MNEIVVSTQKSVLNVMADRYGMEPKPFEQVVMAICMPASSTREQFAAFLLVAKEYNLNPLTKEIYAFPAKGGGIVPVVSIDGWISLVNSHKACDGFSFSWEQDADGAPISCTCTMYRKDRAHPVIITEYLAECIRSTDPWKMKRRMLRHKTMIQAARYAFGFSGIYDEDEAAKIAETTTYRETPPPAPPAPEEPPPANAAPKPSEPTGAQDAPEARPIDPAPQNMDDAHGGEPGNSTSEEPTRNDADEFLTELEEALSGATTAAEVEAQFDQADVPVALSDEADIAKAFELKKLALWRVNRPTEAEGQGDLLGGQTEDDAPPPAPRPVADEIPFPGDASFPKPMTLTRPQK